MDEADKDPHGFGFGIGPLFVSLTPICSPSPRRLSSSFSEPIRPVCKRLAWMSLQGRLVNAEEASSARAIKGGLRNEEAVAWEMFSPIERFLIVAVIGVAVSESKKNSEICRLRKAVEMRDQVLATMQQKLDNLCEHMNTKILESSPTEAFGTDKIKFVDCGCWLCEHHHDLSDALAGKSIIKPSNGDDVLQYKMPFNCEEEQEERRMSDLSDWASSVTSTADLQINSLAVDQDICNLKKECEEKDATIKELTTLLHSSDVSGSKRIAELEDIIRRKSMIITKLRKDMVVLEQKVVQLTRLRRPSAVTSQSTRQIPLLTDNLLYDMDSTTSPSSSDSDSSPKDRFQAPIPKFQQSTPLCTGTSKSQKVATPKSSSSFMKGNDPISGPVDPLKEILSNQKSELESRRKPLSSAGDCTRSRKRTQIGSKNATPKKRWV